MKNLKEKKMLSTDDYTYWKATEYRFFTLFCSPLILEEIVSDKVLNHFLILHVACRMISINRALRFARIAESYSTDFVNQTKTIYSSEFVTLNIHYLNHSVDDIRNIQSNLNDISAFPFENELGKIKRILRSPQNSCSVLKKNS